MDDAPVPYIERTRSWYLALGYDNPYRWAQFDEVPFTRLAKPLAQCSVALITTAAPYQDGKGPQGPGAPYNPAIKFYRPYSGDSAVDPDLRIVHVAVDLKHASLEDANCWFPLPALREAARRGRIGRVAPRFHGAPTNRSQRHTLEVDAPEIVQRCREDGADAAVLVPNCPVCHQTLAIVARELERAGIATVIMGAAKDIVERVGVPRFLFSDFPLGNAAGRPHDPGSQRTTLELALGLLESATGPRTTLQSPLRWQGAPDWKQDYCNVDRVTPEELQRLRREFDAGKAVASAIRQNMR